jgi:triphosphatase
MKNNLEIELKLQVAAPAIWPGLLASSLLAEWSGGAVWQQQSMEASYFDTAAHVLQERHIAYRVRREGSKWIATVKSGGSSEGGLHQRQEWNVEAADKSPNISVFRDTAFWPVLQQIVGAEPLLPLFVTSFVRRTLVICTEGGAVVEIAADQGEILAGGKSAPILELELELKEGNPASLLQLGALLTAEYPLLLESRSKYHRAMELAGLIVAQQSAGEADVVQANALKNIQDLLAAQHILHRAGRDVRRATALLLELWAELI